MEYAISVLQKRIAEHQRYLNLPGHSDVVINLITDKISQLQQAIYKLKFSKD